MNDNTIVAVIGAGACPDAVAARAREVGRRLAEAGYVVICGGLGGVMKAACQGATEAGGLTIGVLPGDSAEAANPHVTIPIVTGMGAARNVIVVRSAQAVIAVDGGPGTLSEIAHCLQFGVPVFGLGSWDIPGVEQVDSPEGAVSKAVAIARKR